MITYECLLICSDFEVFLCNYKKPPFPKGGGAKRRRVALTLHNPKISEAPMAHEDHQDIVREIKENMPDADTLWEALNDDNKVSLYANINGDVKLYNKNLGD